MHFLLTKKLKYFITVMEKRCLTKASEDLFITRSPLGKTINELEEILGEKLFLREHGQYQPTDFAEELYEHTFPMYKKLLNLEEQFKNKDQRRNISIILDSSFPDNVADVVLSILGKNEKLLEVSRKHVLQEDLDLLHARPDFLIISNNSLVVDDSIETLQYDSSSLLLIMNKKLKNNREQMENAPILLRSNISGLTTGRLTSCLQKLLGFMPKVCHVNGTVFDCLLMMGNGDGLMLLPLKTCELMNINREYTLLLDNLNFKVSYYYRKTAKNKKEINNIIKQINTLF